MTRSKHYMSGLEMEHDRGGIEQWKRVLDKMELLENPQVIG